MHKIIAILNIRWIRGIEKLKTLEITLLFANKEITLKISARSEIKRLVKKHFCILCKTSQNKLICDLKRELKFNQRQCKKVIKINYKIKNVMTQSKELLN